jgi:DUF2892 family protein
METNVGTADRTIRIALGLVLLSLAQTARRAEARYARGEVSRDQYEEMRRVLDS